MKRPVNVYVEVPAWEWIIDNNSSFALSYEHCSYYTAASLILIMRQQGYWPDQVVFAFDNEYLQYFGSNNSKKGLENYSAPDTLRSIATRTEKFTKNISFAFNKVEKLFRKLSDKAVLWGAAGKGTTLLNLLAITHKQLEYVVDNNPARHDTYIPGGQQVTSPDVLRKINPEYILITNSGYLDEIKAQLYSIQVSSEFILIDKILNDTQAATT